MLLHTAGKGLKTCTRTDCPERFHPAPLPQAFASSNEAKLLSSGQQGATLGGSPGGDGHAGQAPAGTDGRGPTQRDTAAATAVKDEAAAGQRPGPVLDGATAGEAGGAREVQRNGDVEMTAADAAGAAAEAEGGAEGLQNRNGSGAMCESVSGSGTRGPEVPDGKAAGARGGDAADTGAARPAAGIEAGTTTVSGGAAAVAREVSRGAAEAAPGGEHAAAATAANADAAVAEATDAAEALVPGSGLRGLVGEQGLVVGLGAARGPALVELGGGGSALVVDVGQRAAVSDMAGRGVGSAGSLPAWVGQGRGPLPQRLGLSRRMFLAIAEQLPVGEWAAVKGKTGLPKEDCSRTTD